MFRSLKALLFGLLLASGVSVWGASIDPVQPALQLNKVEQGIIDSTNAQRAASGLPPLAIEPTLEVRARNHAAWMTNNRSMQHSGQNCGENIAWGQRSVAEVVAVWMNSPGHRANILNGGYRKMAAAAYTAADGSIYWCEQFTP
jgi:uncharacterized protein YkwD